MMFDLKLDQLIDILDANSLAKRLKESCMQHHYYFVHPNLKRHSNETNNISIHIGNFLVRISNKFLMDISAGNMDS